MRGRSTFPATASVHEADIETLEHAYFHIHETLTRSEDPWTGHEKYWRRAAIAIDKHSRHSFELDVMKDHDMEYQIENERESRRDGAW